MLVKAEASQSKVQDSKSDFKEPKQENRRLEGFYEELAIVKKVVTDTSVTVSVRKCHETAKNLLYLETDLPGDVVIHWGVCRAESKEWEIPAAPYPPETTVFKNKALRTLLKVSVALCGREMELSCCDAFFFFLFLNVKLLKFIFNVIQLYSVSKLQIVTYCQIWL